MPVSLPLWIEVKAVTGEAIDDAKGNKVCAAVCTRIDRAATFSDYANPTEIKRVIPLDAAIEVDQHNLSNGHRPRHIELAARQINHLLVPIPAVALGGSVLGKVTAAALKETSEVFVALGAALEDDQISKCENKHLAAEIDDAMAKLAALKLQIAAEAKGGAQ